MNKRFIIFTLFYLFLACSTFSQDRGFGIGLIAGEPTGLSVKKWTGSTVAIDAAIAWSFIDEQAFHLHADILMHRFGLINTGRGKMPVYIGLGARLKLANTTVLGARVPVGIDYMFANGPFDLFFEGVPVLNLVPATVFDVNAAIGFRVFF
jgi:hypothetical protein